MESVLVRASMSELVWDHNVDHSVRTKLGGNLGRREHQRSVYLRSDKGQSKMYLTCVDWEAETSSGQSS